MVTTNIFRIASSDLGPEDKYTAFLHYLLESIPSIGQEVVDVICQRSGLPQATFERAVDHPEGDAENKPDFMLSCKEFDILCEHKLDSDLGTDQLERYLGLPKNRPTHLVLITNRLHTISEEVVQSNNYLRPNDSFTPYFFWEDFYPIVVSHPERLAQDFAAFMRELGMAPCQLTDDWEELFRQPDIAEKFFDATKEMRTYFKKIGAECKADPSRLGFQVKYPCDWLHLLYFYVSKVTKPPVVGIEPPYLIANVFVQESELGHLKHLQSIDIPTNNGLIVGRLVKEPAPWNKKLVLSYQYLGSLKNYLADNSAETKMKLRGFGHDVFNHVTNASH